MESREHVLKLCLPPELHLALIKFQARHELGRPYAGLLLLVKAMYQEQLISREVYEAYVYRYSRRLTFENAIESKMSREQVVERQRLEQKARQFKLVMDQWSIHGAEWRQKWLLEAEKWHDRLPEARLLLEKFAGKVLGGS